MPALISKYGLIGRDLTWKLNWCLLHNREDEMTAELAPGWCQRLCFWDPGSGHLFGLSISNHNMKGREKWLREKGRQYQVLTRRWKGRISYRLVGATFATSVLENFRTRLLDPSPMTRHLPSWIHTQEICKQVPPQTQTGKVTATPLISDKAGKRPSAHRWDMKE